MNDGATKQETLGVIRTLRKAGYDALLAGGCVRDMLLGTRPTDYDVATSATPKQVKKLFRRVLMVGAKFGVAMVLLGRRTVEVATFRDDLSYSDGRRPDSVRFSTPREDAQRRDFTINGMFYDPIADEVIDYVGGQADLTARVIRAIGDPDKRFSEDYLRLLRAVRFAARLGFDIEAATTEAVRTHASKLVKISGERVYDELGKMLAGANAARAVNMLGELSLIEPIFGAETAGRDRWSIIEHRLATLADRRDAALSLAAIVIDSDGRSIRALCRHWGVSNTLRDTLVDLAKHASAWPTAADLPLPAFKRLMALPTWDRLRLLWRVEELRLTECDHESRRIARRAGAIDPKQVHPAPFVTGADLKAMGLTEGPRLGSLLRRLYDLQLDEQLTSRRAAMSKAKAMMHD